MPNLLRKRAIAPPKSCELNTQQLLIENESFHALFIINRLCENNAMIMKLSYSNSWGQKKTPTVDNALRIAGVKKRPQS